jgi:hypothetical protein
MKFLCVQHGRCRRLGLLRLRVARLWFVGISLAFLSVAGCGGSAASVEGTVTLDGQPVEGGPDLYGTVSFFPTGGGAPAVGIIQSSGSYVVETGSREGLAPGKYAVAVSIKKIHPAATPEGLTRPERISPIKYSKPMESGLTAEVAPGGNTFDFDLVSDAGR